MDGRPSDLKSEADGSCRSAVHQHYGRNMFICKRFEMMSSCLQGAWMDVDWVKPRVPEVWCADAGWRCALPSCLQGGCSNAAKKGSGVSPAHRSWQQWQGALRQALCWHPR